MKIQVKDSRGTAVELIDNYGVMNTPQAMRDADTGIFFARQLELNLAKAFEVKYPNFQARSLFPINNEGGPWVDTIVAEYYDKIGKAEIGTGEETVMPRADIKGGELRSAVRAIVTSFGYSWLEIQRAMHAGKSLEQRRVNAAIHAYETKLNEIAFFGDSKAGLQGFLTCSDVPRASVSATGTGDSTKFEDKVTTPQRIIDDINALLAKPWIDSGMIHFPNTLLLPPDQFRIISETKASDYTDKTILTSLMENNIFLKQGGQVLPVNELKGAGTNGADIAVAFEKNSDNLEFYIPYDQNFMAVQQEGLQFVVPSIGMTGGVIWRYPKSANIGEGI